MIRCLNNTGLYFHSYTDTFINCHNNCDMAYLRVAIICRYIFLQVWLEICFVSTKICNLYEEIVHGRQYNVLYQNLGTSYTSIPVKKFSLGNSLFHY